MADAVPTPRRSRLARVGLWSGAIALTLVLLLTGIAWWASSQGSLPRALNWAQRFLPEGQTLAFTEVQGSITGGGRIARLQWSKPGTTVTIEDLRVEYSLRWLFGRDLNVRVLSARNVHVLSTPTPDKPDDPPFVMPEDVSLPLTVSVPIAVARLQLESVDEAGLRSTQVIEQLAAFYRYDGNQHALRLDSLRYGQSNLRGEAQLHARELTLSSRFIATLRDLVPDVPFAMTAQLTAKGTLAGGDAAALDVQLDATQQPHDAAQAARAGGAQLQAQASIHPWRDQPAQQVKLDMSGIDAHDFAAAAPITALRGHASLDPVAGGGAASWDAVLDLTNEQPGAWDQQHLPLRQLATRAHFSPELLDIQSAQVDLAGRAPSGRITLTGQVPLKQFAKTTLQMDLKQVDLQPLMTTLPKTALTGPLNIKPWQQDSWQALADVRNTLPGPLDQERLPMNRLLADLRVAPALWRAEKLEMQIGSGRVQAQGSFTPDTQAVQVRGEVQRLPLRQIHRKMANDVASELSGKLSVDGSLQQGLAFDADVASDSASETRQTSEWEIRAVRARGKWSPSRLTVDTVHLDAMQAQVDGSDIDVLLPDMDSIKAKVTATAPGVQLAADTAMVRQSGEGKLSLQLESAEKLVAWLRGLPVIGKQLPELKASGAASLTADWNGGWRQWLAGIGKPASQPRLRMNAVASTAGLHFEMPAADGEPPQKVDVQKLQLDLHGNLAAATLAIDGDARANDTRAVVDIRMQATQAGGNANAPRWNIAVEKFTAAATLPNEDEPWRLQLSDNLQLTVQSGANMELRANAGSATLSMPDSETLGDEPLKLAWEPVLLRHGPRGTTLESKGTATGIQPAWADVLLKDKKLKEGPLTGAGMRTDLMLSGEWDIRMTDDIDIRAHLKRDSGDLWLVDPETAAGIRTLDLTVQSIDEKVDVALKWDTARAGVITANLTTRLEQQADGWSLPDDAPLSGSIKANLQDLNTWAFLAPPGWRVQGAMDLDVRIAGTVQKPQLNGGIEAKGLNLRSVLDGVDLHNGTLRARLANSSMLIEELTFEGGTGSRAYIRGFSGNRTSAPTARGRMTATGSIDWGGVTDAAKAESGITMDIKAQLQRMQVLVRNDRQMTLSGDLSAKLDKGALTVRGDLRVDRATVTLPKETAPTLGDDVVVVRNTTLKNAGAVEARQARGELETRKPMDIEIRLDLGQDLAFEGENITTRLEGDLTVRNATYGSDPFAVYGEVRTVEGRYRGWNQALNVETGVVRFNGSYRNPSLNLLAIRPEIEVRAGVRVTGTLMAPRVQLFSEPDLPEGEKLSWVVLGRPANVGGGTDGSQLQQAAISVAAGQLSGKLTSGLGLDELGLDAGAVTIGKRISNELYLTYEAGLAGAASTLFIFYDITRKLTLRAQNVRAQDGYSNAVDLVYTIKFD